MGTPAGKLVRLKRLSVQGFKALDSLELDFPPPAMTHDPDVLVLGSRNGMGKTSVLEACAILYLYLGSSVRRSDDGKLVEIQHLPGAGDHADMLVRSGRVSASISGDLELEGEVYQVTVDLNRDGIASVTGQTLKLFEHLDDVKELPANDISRSLPEILGFVPDSFLSPFCLGFHSFRKVAENKPRLNPNPMLAFPIGLTVGHLSADPAGPTNRFKQEVVKLLMARARLFDDVDPQESTKDLGKLNALMTRYAGGQVGRLRTNPANGTVSLLVQPDGGGAPFPFDSLSSGQKEILSTLFLIWHHTDARPATVLIDEPELHLNAEWHRTIVRDLYDLVPDNQYILATHSEDVFASVEPYQRRLLVPDAAAVSG